MKVEILELLSDGRWWTAPEVAHQLGMSLVNASQLLRRYHNNGWLRRHRIRTKYNPPRLYEYQITERGLQKLEYYTSPAMKSAEKAREVLGFGRKTLHYIANKLREG